MKWLKWQKGRQESGYDKMLLATAKWPVPFDFYLLKFPTGSKINTHVDPVATGMKHYRINIIIWRAIKGGEFVSEQTIVDWPRIKLFRPDVVPHSVTRVEEGTRYVLSIGWLRHEKKATNTGTVP